MEKTIMGVCSIILALCMALVVIGCAEEEVDEEDMSRWILRFSSEYPSDMENGYLEMSAKELIDRRFEYNELKISFQWDEKYIDIGNADWSFTLEPDITLYYINDSGERIENGALNDDKYYVVMYSIRKIEEDENTKKDRVVLPGLYEVAYDIRKNDTNGTDNIGDKITVNYFVGNINQ